MVLPTEPRHKHLELFLSKKYAPKPPGYVSTAQDYAKYNLYRQLKYKSAKY